jgi:hypothetical protein
MHGQYNGKQIQEVKRVWYGGVTLLKLGQAVAYDTSDTTAPLPTSLGGSTAPDPSQIERGQVVVDPATAVLGGFAGIVATQPQRDPADSTKAVASWIDIYVPRKGDIVDVWSSANATKNSTILGITNAGAATLVAVSDATFNVDAVAIALQTIDRSSTNGYIRSKFL